MKISNDFEIIQMTSISPFIAKVKIKVLYTGKNRNKTFISKQTADQMANSLPGVPIIGIYNRETGDFLDHGEEEMIVTEQGLDFVKNTVPYGFVDLSAQPYWESSLDKDGILREYLTVDGYVWTQRYPETKRLLEGFNNQSMELDRFSMVGEWEVIDGAWASFENEADRYFNIREAYLTGLCILGEDVEPCFEGAGFKPSNYSFSLNKNEFKETLANFMAELKEILQGGEPVDNIVTDEFKNDETQPEVDNAVVEDEKKPKTNCTEDPEVDNAAKDEPEVDNAVKDEPVVDNVFPPKKDDEEEDSKDGDEEKDPTEDKPKEDDKKKKYNLDEVEEYTALLNEYNTLKAQLDAMVPEYNLLKEESIKRENADKDAMIASFYMLSEADKAPVVALKDTLTVEQIEEKLSVIGVRNKVNFSLMEEDETKNDIEQPITTFNVNSVVDDTPAWLKAVERFKKQ